MTDRTGTRRSRGRAARDGRSTSAPRTRKQGNGIRLSVVSAIAAIGALALIAVVVALGVAPRPGSTAAGGITPAALPGGIVHAGMSLGRPDAPVRVDLYEDFQCPACRQWG